MKVKHLKFVAATAPVRRRLLKLSLAVLYLALMLILKPLMVRLRSINKSALAYTNKK
ncbi:hypothetical protein D3C79_986830 [compost metagenome]